MKQFMNNWIFQFCTEIEWISWPLDQYFLIIKRFPNVDIERHKIITKSIVRKANIIWDKPPAHLRSSLYHRRWADWNRADNPPRNSCSLPRRLRGPRVWNSFALFELILFKFYWLMDLGTFFEGISERITSITFMPFVKHIRVRPFILTCTNWQSVSQVVSLPLPGCTRSLKNEFLIKIFIFPRKYSEHFSHSVSRLNQQMLSDPFLW